MPPVPPKNAPVWSVGSAPNFKAPPRPRPASAWRWKRKSSSPPAPRAWIGRLRSPSASVPCAITSCKPPPQSRPKPSPAISPAPASPKLKRSSKPSPRLATPNRTPPDTTPERPRIFRAKHAELDIGVIARNTLQRQCCSLNSSNVGRAVSRQHAGTNPERDVEFLLTPLFVRHASTCRDSAHYPPPSRLLGLNPSKWLRSNESRMFLEHVLEELRASR